MKRYVSNVFAFRSIHVDYIHTSVHIVLNHLGRSITCRNERFICLYSDRRNPQHQCPHKSHDNIDLDWIRDLPDRTPDQPDQNMSVFSWITVSENDSPQNLRLGTWLSSDLELDYLLARIRYDLWWMCVTWDVSHGHTHVSELMDIGYKSMFEPHEWGFGDHLDNWYGFAIVVTMFCSFLIKRIVYRIAHR